VDAFGPRGVQQHIYQTVSTQLQDIANHFLETLTDGAMQLQLQADVNNEQITKLVHMHSFQGEAPQERLLSQLSGGQWRRVR
jgi:hypothetical protein